MNKLELRRWLEDCIKNAKKEGLSEDDILIVFMDKIMFLLTTESPTLELEIVLLLILLMREKSQMLEKKGVVHV